MELTPEILASGVVGVLVIAAAIGTYLKSLKAPSPNPMMAGIGGGFVDREQMAQLIAAVNRVADVLSDKNAANLNERLDDIMDRLDGKKPPPRRA